MNSAALVFLVALLSLFRGPYRACIRARSEVIARQATDAASADRVPVGVLLVVGYLESHLGCHPRSGGCWGAPVSPHRRGTAGTPRHASRALAWGYRRCGSDFGAVSHFRCGACSCPHLIGYQPDDAMRLLDRVTARAMSDGGAP